MSTSRWGHAPFVTALTLVTLPNLIFLTTHLASPVLGAGCAAAVAAGVALCLRTVLRTPLALDVPLWLVSLAAGFLLNALGGQGHWVFANDDWLIRDAVLRDLVAEPWPVGYRYLGDATMLRAPLGLYLLPASVGGWFGLRAAALTLLAQDSLLFGCLFAVLAQSFPPRRVGLGVLAIFVAFGGWDVVGAWILGEPIALGAQLEHWMPGQEFTSHVTQVFWVPNHTASGWMFVAAYLLWHRRCLDLGGLVGVFGLCVFWSPLSMIGALPFLARAVFVDGAAGRLRIRQGCVPVLIGLGLVPVLLFLSADGGRVPHGFRTVDPTFLVGMALFLLVEIGPVVAFLAAARQPDRNASRLRGDLPVILAILLFVPFYRLGQTDFVMRASIPALALLALRFGEVATLTPSSRQRWAAVAVAVIGAAAPASEIARAFQRPADDVSDCTLLDASRVPPNDGPLFHYLARTDRLEGSPAGRILAPPARIMAWQPRPPCWPNR